MPLRSPPQARVVTMAGVPIDFNPSYAPLAIQLSDINCTELSYIGTRPSIPQNETEQDEVEYSKQLQIIWKAIRHLSIQFILTTISDGEGVHCEDEQNPVIRLRHINTFAQTISCDIQRSSLCNEFDSEEMFELIAHERYFEENLK
ncbi:unnamed protein product [Agarophyton chilense]